MVTLLASSLKLNRRFPGPSESQKSGQTRLSPSCPTCLGLAVTQRLTASPEIRPFVTSWIIHEPPNIFRQGNPGPPKARKYYKSKSRSLLGNYVEPAGKGRPQNTRWHVSPFEGGFFAIFTVWGRIICIFPPFSVISLQPLTFQGEFFAFFSLSGWILCNFQPFRGNSFHFWLFKGEFFVFFTLQGWILCNFYSWGWILCNFYPSKVKSVQFLSFWDIFWVKRTKNYSCNGEFFEILVFILVIGVFLSGILRVCCFDTNHPGFFGWFVDIFYPSSVYFLQYLPFGYF